MPFAPGRGSLPPFEFLTPRPPPIPLGHIVCSVATFTANQSINLTSLASTDWAAFGYNVNAASIERRSTGGSNISTLSQVGSIALGSSNHGASTPHWSVTWGPDGTPDASVSAEGFQVFCSAPTGPAGTGMSFTVPADTSSRILLIYVCVSNNGTTSTSGKLTATLSDSSANPYTNTAVGTISSDSQAKLGQYTITYNAASAGQTLRINWVNNTASGQNVQLFAAVLSGPVALLSTSSVSSTAIAAGAGAIPILASTKAAAGGAAQFSGAIGLLAFGGLSAAIGRVGSSLAAALQAYAAASSGGRATPIGKVALAAMGAAKGAARAAASILASGQVALTAVARASAGAIAFMAGVVPLSAKGRTSATTKGAARLAAWLLSISGGRGQASAPVKGVLTLTSASAARGKGMATPGFAVPLTSLSAFGRGIANAFGALFLQRPLFVDPNYVVQYPAPSRLVQYPELITAAQYPEPVRSVSYPGV